MVILYIYICTLCIIVLKQAVVFLEPGSSSFKAPLNYSIPSLSTGTQFCMESPACCMKGLSFDHFYTNMHCPKILMNITVNTLLMHLLLYSLHKTHPTYPISTSHTMHMQWLRAHAHSPYPMYHAGSGSLLYPWWGGMGHMSFESLL